MKTMSLLFQVGAPIRSEDGPKTVDIVKARRGGRDGYWFITDMDVFFVYEKDADQMARMMLFDPPKPPPREDSHADFASKLIKEDLREN